MKKSKKLDFEDEVSEFAFKPIKPLTRQSKTLQQPNMEIDQTRGEDANVFEEPINISSQILEEDRNRVFNI